MAVAERRRGEGAGRARPEHVDHALAARPELADEQAAVVRGLTQSGDGVQVVRAPAGTGKTYALEAARDAWEASGHRVIGCALSARAAVELESQAGIDSTTIARLKLDLDRGYGLAAHNVLVVDEAGMVGTRALAELSANADAVGAKLVLVGDDRQLPEIDAGGAFRGIAERIGALELHETRRQRYEWDREALSALRDGDLDGWAARYRETGRLVARPTGRMVREELVTDWWHAARDESVDAVMIAHRRVDVAELNDRARALMAADGRLGEIELDAGGRSFAQGDRVLAKHNDRRAGIVNGARGQVLAVDVERRAITVELQGGEQVVLDADYLDHGHLDHGYAVTAHAAQGATVDRAFVLGSDDLYREWGYTAMTRHRDEARFYLISPSSTERSLPGLQPEPDPLLKDLAEMLGDSREKSLAIDVLDNATVTASGESRDLLASYRAIAASTSRHDSDLHAAEAAREAAEARIAELTDERAELGWLQRQRRAELDQQISQNEIARTRWAAESERLAESAAAARHEHDTWLAENDLALRHALIDEQLLSGRSTIESDDELRDLIANRELPDHIGGRPLNLAGRDAWAARAVDSVEAEFADMRLAPEAAAPDFDLGP